MKLLRLACLALFLLTLTTHPAPAHAQGCSMCRDASAGSAPRARQGLRRAILVLGIPAAGLFVGIVLLARRMDQKN